MKIHLLAGDQENVHTWCGIKVSNLLPSEDDWIMTGAGQGVIGLLVTDKRDKADCDECQEAYEKR